MPSGTDFVSRLKQAIDDDDVATVKELMTSDPGLHSAALGYNGNGPLTWVAECRGTTATPERLEMARWMIENGSDLHQGGDGLHVAPLDGTTLLHFAVEYTELEIAGYLIGKGADVNARASIDSDGFGGHTPLFHTTVTLGPRSSDLAEQFQEPAWANEPAIAAIQAHLHL